MPYCAIIDLLIINGMEPYLFSWIIFPNLGIVDGLERFQRENDNIPFISPDAAKDRKVY